MQNWMLNDNLSRGILQQKRTSETRPFAVYSAVSASFSAFESL